MTAISAQAMVLKTRPLGGRSGGHTVASISLDVDIDFGLDVLGFLGHGGAGRGRGDGGRKDAFVTSHDGWVTLSLLKGSAD